MNAPVFFFTAEDPREIPKGSRDPLRVLPVWTPVARKMIPFLTTVTPSYRGFLTRVLFHGMLEEFEPALANASIDEQWPAFCKFEQLCGLVRAELQPSTPNFPGISGVPGRVKDGTVTLGSDTPYWLVRSQKNTGYWGYYHQASLGSRLIQLNCALRPGYRLTDKALEVYRNSAASSLMKGYQPQLKSLIKSKAVKVDLDGMQDLAQLFAQKPLSSDGNWGEFWLNHLLIPQSSPERCYSTGVLQEFAQRLLAEVTTDLSVGQVWEQLAQGLVDSPVTQFATEVMATEAVIGLCEWTFDACRLRHPKKTDLSTAANWAYDNGYSSDWLERLRRISEPEDIELRRFREVALHSSKSFESLARELLQRHKAVMLDRKGAAWVEINDDDELIIRDPAEEPWLPDFERTPSGVRWRYDYFLGSWINVAREIGYLAEPANG